MDGADVTLGDAKVFSHTTNITPISAASGICSIQLEANRMNENRNRDAAMPDRRPQAPLLRLTSTRASATVKPLSSLVFKPAGETDCEANTPGGGARGAIKIKSPGGGVGAASGGCACDGKRCAAADGSLHYLRTTSCDGRLER